MPYLNVAAAVGMTSEDVALLLKRIEATIRDLAKKTSPNEERIL